MAMWTRRQAISTLGLATAMPLLAACSDDGPEPDPESPSSTGIDTEAIVETRAVVTAWGEIEVGIHPVVRSGEHCLLTLDLEPLTLPEGEAEVPARRFETDATLVGRPTMLEPWAALRLIDPGGNRVRLVATTAEGRVVGRATHGELSVPEAGMRLQLAYAAPENGVETIGLLMPGWYVPQLPLVEGDVPEVTAEDGDDIPSVEDALGTIAQAPVAPLEGYTRQLDGGVQVVESTEQIEIRLAGDVLFASSSYELDDRAAGVLDAAAASIAAYEGGVVDVVGHTDDIGSDAENQTLSESRANAVAGALATRIDTAAYELRPDGRGESEPLVANSSDANRQLNRRVTLTLTSEKTSEVEVETEGTIPPFQDGPLHDGAEADAVEGFEREEGEGHSYRISAPSARRVGGMLEVTVLAERLPGEGTGGYGSALNLGTGTWSYRGDKTGYSADYAGFAPRLLVGSTATYPLDYLLGDSAIEGHQEWRIASDPGATDDAAVGATLRFVALYRDLPGVDTLVLEQPYVLGVRAFRLSGIPVEG